MLVRRPCRCIQSEEVGGLGSYCDFGALVPFPRLGKLVGRSPVVTVDLVVADLHFFFRTMRHANYNLEYDRGLRSESDLIVNRGMCLARLSPRLG